MTCAECGRTFDNRDTQETFLSVDDRAWCRDCIHAVIEQQAQRRLAGRGYLWNVHNNCHVRSEPGCEWCGQEVMA